jgi:antitoxin component of MazEF toxin-antitoxin module
MSIQKILKVGNSLGLTLPSGLVKSLSLRSGDNVDVVRGQGNTLVIGFPDSHQLSLELTRTQKTPKKKI